MQTPTSATPQTAMLKAAPAPSVGWKLVLPLLWEGLGQHVVAKTLLTRLGWWVCSPVCSCDPEDVCA